MELGETFFVDARMFQLEEWEEGGGTFKRMFLYGNEYKFLQRLYSTKVSIKRGKKYHKLHRSPLWTQQIRETRAVNESTL